MRKVIVVITALTIGFNAGCSKKDKAELDARWPVGKGTVKETVEEIGFLAALASVEISSEISGQVTEILVDVGDHVEKDQVLARVRGGYEAEDYKVGEIRSPIAGVVIDRNLGPNGKKIEPGDRIRDNLSGFASGTILMKIAQLDKMIFEVRINEMDAARIRKGQACEVIVDAIPGRTFKGELIRVSPTAKSSREGVRAFKTEVALLELDTRIRPGMTARAKIVVARCNDCVKLSLARYYNEECGGKKLHVAYVYNPDPKGEPNRRILTVTAKDGVFAGVTKGLKEGEKVVQRPEGRPNDKECAGKKGGAKDWSKWKGKGKH